MITEILEQIQQQYLFNFTNEDGLRDILVALAESSSSETVATYQNIVRSGPARMITVLSDFNYGGQSHRYRWDGSILFDQIEQEV